MSTPDKPSTIYGGRDESFERFVDEFSRRFSAQLTAARSADAVAYERGSRLDLAPRRSASVLRTRARS